jgi:hypothetical protein
MGITITYSKPPFFQHALMALVFVSFCLAGISLLVQDLNETRTRALALDQLHAQAHASSKELTVTQAPVAPVRAGAGGR